MREIERNTHKTGKHILNKTFMALTQRVRYTSRWRPMKRKLIVCFFALAIAVSAMPSPASAQSLDFFSIRMVGYPSRANTMVAGLFHNVTVALDGPSDDVVVKANFNSPFTDAGINNTYRWSYNAGAWTDELYDYYINTSACLRAEDKFHFVVAVDSTVNHGSWRWIVDVDGSEVYNNSFYVEEPVAGIRMSSPTFYFRIFPYNTGYISSYIPGEPANSSYFTTENIGNTPLDISISYESLNSLFSTSNSTGTWETGEKRSHYIEFQAQSWSPRKFEVKGVIHGQPKLLATPQTVSLTVTPSTTYDVVVTVARQGYDVFQFGNIVAQYKNLYPSKYGKSLNLDLFLTAREGTDSAYLGAETNNLTINKITYLDEDRNSPFLLSVNDVDEAHVIVNVSCTTRPARGQTSILTYANFRIELNDFSDSDTFTSTVIVAQVSGGDDDPGLGPPSMIALAFILIMIMLIGLFVWQTRRKAELKKRIELEERIRRRKLKALKKRKK